ncbi:AP-1 complex subunit mu-1-I [Dirofilaria immitis]
MSSSAIYILDLKGKVIISRNYRGDIDMAIIDKFMPLLLELEEEGRQSPALEHPEATFIYVRHSNLYFVSTSRKNVNVALVLSFLYKIVEVFGEYLKDVEEESIRDNFVIIYELLDEMMDFGYPQTTEGKILQEFITQEGHKLETAPRPPMAVTNAVSWRSEGLKYRKNEVFLDVIESVNLLANANGVVLQSEIVGSVKMRVYLTGMPELRLGLNDKVLFESSGRGKNRSVELEDVKFHQCVRLSRFENDRTISFIPPDGEFELMSYRLMTVVKPLIWMEAVVERHTHSRVEYMIKAKSQFKRRSTANNVEIIIPVPSDADSPKFKTSIGTVKYTPEQNSFVWTIKSFPGGKEYLMRAHFNLPSVQCEDREGRPPMKVKFEIPYFTTSGIQVRYLKIIEKSGYQALPWVRYITQNGDYQLRMISSFGTAMIHRRVILSSLFRCYGIFPSRMSCFRRDFFWFISVCIGQEQRYKRHSRLLLNSSNVPFLKFEQCKFNCSLEGTEYNIQKDCKVTECTKIECGNDIRIVEAAASKKMVKESISGMEIVELIVTKLRGNGQFFILPVNDITAMKALTKIFTLLLDIGIQPDFIIDSCVCAPQLFVSLTQKGEISIQIIELIVDFCRLTYEDSIRIFATYNEELLTAGPEEIQKCMEVLYSYGFHNGKLGEAICSCPALLFAHKSNRLAQNAENLFSHFSRNQFHSLLKSSPEILLGNTNETEDKIEYIYCHMLMEGEDFANCTNLTQLSLEELIDRHEFLLKTGTYKTPDLKRPQLKMKNSKLREILDSNAEQFAKKVGHVSIEEWYLFRELQSKRRVLELEGKVRPFERIKPSMRKLSERKKKSISSNDSETFDLYNEKY